MNENAVRYKGNCAERLECREPWQAELAVVLAGGKKLGPSKAWSALSQYTVVVDRK